MGRVRECMRQIQILRGCAPQSLRNDCFLHLRVLAQTGRGAIHGRMFEVRIPEGTKEAFQMATVDAAGRFARPAPRHRLLLTCR